MAAWRYEISLLVLKKYFQQKTKTKKTDRRRFRPQPWPLVLVTPASYPGRANFSYIYLQNVANRLHEKQTDED